jgi:hypothetical protein
MFYCLCFSGYIPIKDVKITYSTSSGPGGQNVNRVATKVDLRYSTTIFLMYTGSFSYPIRLISDPNPDGNKNVSTKQFLTISLSFFAGTDISLW